MNVIRVTQVLDEHTLEEIVSLKLSPTFWDRLHRVFPVQAGDDEPLRCWLDLLDESGDALDDPIVVSADQARWLLRELCHRPASEWKRIQVGEG